MDKKRKTRKEKFSNIPSPEKSGEKRGSHNSKWIPGLIVAVVGFLLYSNTLNHGFALDDYSIILENRITKQGAAAIPEIFKSSYRAGYYFTDDNLYRPVVKAMFAIEWGISPNSAAPGHWMNVLLYAFTGLILYFTLLRISSGNVFFAFVSSLLFIAHPIHTEVVANIKSRDEIMALLFCILTLDRFIIYLRNQKVKDIVLAVLFYFIALLSKESSITFLAIFPLAGWFFTDTKAGDIGKKMIPILAIAGIFLLIRSAILGGSIPESVSVADNLLMAAKDPFTRFSTAVLILGLYIKLLLFPHPLVFDYSFNQIPLVGVSDWKFILSFLIYCGLLFIAFRGLKSKDLLSFCVFIFLITLSVSSNIFITIGSSMGERFIYAPSLGFCMALSVIAMRAGKYSKDVMNGPIIKSLKYNIPILIITTILIMGFSYKTITRNPVWKNNYTLYSNDVMLSPNSTRTHYYLGNYLVKPEAWEGKTAEEKRATLYKGINELKKSIAIYPSFSDAHLQMGVAYYKLENLDSALICYQKSLAINPNYASTLNNIGTVYFARQQYSDALRYFLDAVKIDPGYSEAHANAGSTYGMLRQYENALSSLFKAIKYDPNYAQSYYFIGLTYRFMGDEKNANAYLEKSYVLDPSLRPKSN